MVRTTLPSTVLEFDLWLHYSPIVERQVDGLKVGIVMKRFTLLFAAIIFSGVTLCAQEKGVDTQNERIRDTGNSRGPANNGTRQDVGTGRGMNFGKYKTPAPVVLPNPYKFTARRDAVISAVENVLKERKMILDTAASRPADGVLISQPYIFVRGAVVTGPELSQYADLPSAESRGWTRGQYTLTIEVQPVDGTTTNVAVNAKIEGRSDGASGAEWISLQSSGMAEQEFLAELVAAITGNTPNQTP